MKLDEAKVLQLEMAAKVERDDRFSSSLSLIAGVDVSHNIYDPQKMIYGACVTLSYPDLREVAVETYSMKQLFPYIPGYLAFREAPVLINAFSKLTSKPDLILVDGHGVSHPKGLGIASYLGVQLDVPTIGVAKSILVGTPEKELGETVGSTASLVYEGEVVAMLLRSKKRCKPVIISTGHRISLQSAVDLIKKMLCGYRLPEPTRRAHLAANQYRCREKLLHN